MSDDLRRGSGSFLEQRRRVAGLTSLALPEARAALSRLRGRS